MATAIAADKEAPIAPGVRQWLPLPIGIVAEARRDTLGYLFRSARRYGDVFRSHVGPQVTHLVTHPDGVKHVLVDHQKNYPRSWIYRHTRLVIGNGLVATEGEVWRRQRQMLQPAFQPQRIAQLAGAMTAVTAEMLDDWRMASNGQPLDVFQEMIGLTLNIVGRALLGVDLAQDRDVITRTVLTALLYLEFRITHLFSPPVWVPTLRNLRFQRAMRSLDEVVFRIIRERREGGPTNDMLSMLMALRDEETGAGLSDQEIRDQVNTFIGAGHETTAVALTWTWYLLSQHRDVQERVRDEVRSVLGDRVPTVADLPRLALTRRVIEESMRLYPPVYAVAKDVVSDDVIGGYRIPARSMILLSQYITHRHLEFWDDAERFDPDRFLPERVAARPRFAYFPFLGGPHHCIGSEFAMMEAMLIVAMTLQRFRLRLTPGAVVEPESKLTLRPRGGLSMLLEPVN
jgi:cytochrome P450